MPGPAKTKKASLATIERARSLSNGKRAAYIDILRIFSCLFVIYNHTNERGFLRFASEPAGSFQWIASVFFASFCKTVPLFYMISGALLLRKDESIGKTLQRTVKILIDLVLFSVFYMWFDSSLAGTAFSLKNALLGTLKGSYWHLWYLYSYIALILTLPILRKFVLSLDQRTSVYFFVLVFFYSSVVPIVEYFWTGTINGSLKPGWLTLYGLLYPVAGYLIENKLKITKRIVYGLWEIVGLCFVIGCVCEYFFLLKEPGSTSERFIQLFMPVNNLTIYVTVKYIFENKKFGDKAYKFLTETGACTFGIYLIHIFFLWKLPVTLDAWTTVEQLSYGGVFISCVCVFILAGMLTWLLRRIPIIRKLL